MITPRLLSLTMILAVGTFFGQSGSYPKPQTPSAAGKPAPDFTLKDQNANDFTLSERRGGWVLLYFYRGYW